ncbi:uncharacterized protein BX664DRAFT_264462 [Halteromyces radiatus]|uniref:uncharacterized protein n=1 Tax=Halteromyces radiatus TaxID=101107 RepID=UPI00221F7E0A|nr:uncharacterized protein BX664DRAFT_264462 [Halteromyces radiatus]KAI8086507.1 hypothetical protein BX664DRAFT_264462 [Halteromyces radiatus]
MKRLNTIPSQPIFSNLINGCLKSRQINKAWKTFDEMRLSYHQPDEVTFTMMLHACAKVKIHGFQPDLITYNTLLGACARKKDLGRAREIFRHILQHDQLEPDHRTFTNLFWSYANYDPPSSSSVPSTSSSSSSSSSALVPNTIDQLVPNSAPTRRSEVVDEAKKIFSYMTQQEDPAIEMTTTLLTAYLNTHVTQRQVKDCVSLYDSLFSKYNVEPNPTTFKVMIRHCYQTKDTALAWRIWDDYQAFLETKASQAYEHTSDMTMMEQKKMKLERHQQQIKEGWTLDQQRSLVLLMASVLAR